MHRHRDMRIIEIIDPQAHRLSGGESSLLPDCFQRPGSVEGAVQRWTAHRAGETTAVVVVAGVGVRSAAGGMVTVVVGSLSGSAESVAPPALIPTLNPYPGGSVGV